MLAIQPSMYVPPLGFRFDPTDEELVSHYLRRKINGEDCFGLIEDMDVYSREPWNLPHKNNLAFKENEWFYFVKRSHASGCKNANGKRPKRTIEGDIHGGCWTATTGDKSITSETGQIVGYKKTLTFYTNKKKNGKGVKTDWIMKEYRLNSDSFQHLVLCKIRHKINPKNPAAAQGVIASVSCTREINASFLESSASSLDFRCRPWSSYASVPEISASALDTGCQPRSLVASGMNASALESPASGLGIGHWISDGSVPESSASALDTGCQPQSLNASCLNALILESPASSLDIGCQPRSSDASGLDASAPESSASALDTRCQPRSLVASGMNASALECPAFGLDIGCWISDGSVLESPASSLDIGCQPQSSDASCLNDLILESPASSLDIRCQPWISDASGLNASVPESSASALDIGCQPLSSDASGLNASVLEPPAAALDIGWEQMELNDMNVWGTDANDWWNQIFVSVSKDEEIIFS